MLRRTTPPPVRDGGAQLWRMDSLRAVGALLVLAAHVVGHAVSHGLDVPLPVVLEPLHRATQIGPFLLFGLSGYLLYLPFVRRDLGAGAPVDLRRYARNRATRILPVYVVSVVVLLWLSGTATPTAFLVYLTFSGNFFAHPREQVNRVLWTVAVEAQFYLVLPLLAALIAWFARGSHRRAAGLIVLLGVASSVLAAAWPDDPGGGGPGWRLSLLTTFAHLAVGMLLAVLRLGWPRLPAVLRTGLFGSGTAWLAAGLTLWVGLLVVARLAIPSAGALAAIVAIDLLLLGGCLLPVRQGRTVRVLDARPLAAIGIVSYSLYAWHDPILREIASWNPPGGLLGLLAIALPACAVVTVASHLLVERPGMALRRCWAARPQGNALVPAPRLGVTTVDRRCSLRRTPTH